MVCSFVYSSINNPSNHQTMVYSGQGSENWWCCVANIEIYPGMCIPVGKRFVTTIRKKLCILYHIILKYMIYIHYIYYNITGNTSAAYAAAAISFTGLSEPVITGLSSLGSSPWGPHIRTAAAAAIDVFQEGASFSALQNPQGSNSGRTGEIRVTCHCTQLFCAE